MITPEEGWKIITDNVRPLETYRTTLIEALGSILAEEVTADRDIPAVDRSAMDGFAANSESLSPFPPTLKVTGEVAAGSGEAPSIGKGECVRIFTGANLPPDADSVILIENTEACGENEIRLLEPVEPGRDIFRRGENGHCGDILIPSGLPLTAERIAVCAAVGAAKPKVFKRPDVTILNTGEELKAPESSITDFQIRDSNGPALEALLKTNRHILKERKTVPDNIEETTSAISKAVSQSSVTIVTGGVSVGKHDYVPAAIESAGGNILFHGVAMKPGKPQLFAMFPENRVVFGLPGNPLSVLTGFHEFVLPILKLMSGLPADICQDRTMLPLSSDAGSKGKRALYHLGNLIQTDSGLAVKPLTRAGSADLAAGAEADGVFKIPDGCRGLPEGSMVSFTRWT